jgi:ankyrin repeat protein
MKELDVQGAVNLFGIARESGTPEVVAALVSGGAAVDLQDKMFKQTALMYAAGNERTPAIAGFLLKAGAKTKLTNAGKRTACDYARENPIFRGTPELADLERAAR